MAKPKLSKSQYLKGRQCPLRLWFYRHRKDLRPETDPATQARFDSGTEIGLLAQTYFGKGVEVDTEYWDIEGAVEKTEGFIAEGHETVFEATAIHPVDGSYARIDIFRKIPDTDEWELIEVKSSTGVKENHIDDMAIQYHVFNGAGYKIRRCYMMLVDNEYIRDGEIDPQGLFKLEDISEQVFTVQEEAAYWAAQLGHVLERKNEPEAKIGSRCFAPHECEYRHHCWANVPEFSIYNIYGKKKADEVFSRIGSYDIKDIPSNLLPSGAKAVDVDCCQNGNDYFDSASIGDFLQDFQYPLYFLDYETIQSGLPLFDGTRPYQQIPFQFSLHVQEAPNAELQHFEFLHKEQTDPRHLFTEALIKSCGDTGSVVVYNQSFEMARNKELADDLPQYAPELQAINGRVIDLMKPFQKRWAYKTAQQGSHSIKYVLPAYVPDLSYDGMAIANGGEAMDRYYMFMTGGIPEEDRSKLWNALAAYCKLDTYAMVALLHVLKKIVDSGGKSF